MAAAAADEIFDAAGIAVITGGGSGFGLEAASRCAKAGMAVAVAEVQQDTLSATQAALEKLAKNPGDVLTHQTDVSDEKSVLAFAEAVFARYFLLHLPIGIYVLWGMGAHITRSTCWGCAILDTYVAVA